MKGHPKVDLEERIFTLSDVKQLYMAKKKRLIKFGLLAAIAAFFFFGLKVPQYKVEATFKEVAEQSDGGGLLKELLTGLSAPAQPQAASFMKSYVVLKPLVQKLGLNVTSPRSGWLVLKAFKRYLDNFKAERGIPLADLDPFLFEDVIYEGDKTFSFGLCFLNKTDFIVQSADRKKELAKGMIGKELIFSEFPGKFTVKKTPKLLKIGQFYPFSIHHWLNAAKELKGNLKIASNKNCHSIYDLILYERDRHLGVRILNGLMHQYQVYLKQEHDFLAKEQLAYLACKQDQMCDNLEGLFQDHVAYQKENLEEKGIFTFEQESQSLLTPHQEMYSRALLIDLELSRLTDLEKEGQAFPLIEEGALSTGINQIFQKIQELKQQRDLLDISLSQVSEETFQERKAELKELRNRRFALEKLLQEVDQGQAVSSLDIIQPGLSLWTTALHDPEQREDFAEYLENYTRLLSLREKMIQERLFYGNQAPPELEGIDLATAHRLFVEYNSKLDQAEAAMKCYSEFKKELQRPDFEIASLHSILKDSFSQQIIGEAAGIQLRLSDERYHSNKEEKRYVEDLTLQRKILSDHLEQLYKVEEINAALIRQKMVGLQKVSVDGINQQISVLQEQARDTMKDHRHSLIQEKTLLKQKMQEIRHSAFVLPEKWQREKWLRLKTDMATKMIETITQAVESKTIANHLHHIESKPLDEAMLPSGPESPYLFQKSVAAGISFPFFLFFFFLIQQIFKGFPTSLNKLEALRLPTLGSISPFCDGPLVESLTGPDLEILRKLALFAKGGKVIGLIGGRGPDYSYALGENFGRMSLKTIVLRCDFLSKFREESSPGLLQFWQGEREEIPIRKGKGFDYITAGGYTPYGTEIIQSLRFQQLLETLKQNYELIFLLLRTPLSSAESSTVLRLCDKAVVTVSGEQIEELTPFAVWAYDENCWRLTFMTHS